MQVDDAVAQAFIKLSNKNSSLRGRKRFIADLDEVKEITKQPVVLQGLRVKRTSRKPLKLTHVL